MTRKGDGPIVVRELRRQELDLAIGLDVGEAGDTIFVQAGATIEARPHRWSRPSRGGREMLGYIDRWKGIVEAGGHAFGAFDGARLVGFAVLRLELEPGVAQLDGLYVDAAYRRTGVATTLSDRADAAARAADASELYVSATPTPSAVGFYLGRGFEPTDLPNAALLALEPDDIHLRKPL